MKNLIFLFIFCIAVGFTCGQDAACLKCICNVESNCRPLSCAMDGGSLSCGYYQIKEVYWIDCGRPGGSLTACSLDKTCSENCVKAYMKRYGTYCTGGRTPTCQDYARIHNGGPLGCKKDSTLTYWNKVNACLSIG
ncbi:lysozyme [Brachionus plicatilis]|uniref:lysozyme n=1 Tax=Brachionus plicatilis TaxID=10195 RepID=A0A3M7SBW4_BRAPC|nr:lysozyme [Brachionus plicatilis]